jgi:hypothetical protein
MFRYLLPKDGPVFEGLESREVIYAKDQPEYMPLRTLVSDGHLRRVISRWTLTDDQRAAIGRGDDIFLMLLTHGNPLQPIQIALGNGKEDHGWIERFLLSEDLWGI